MAQVLGRYHIISELGRGGMGVVYKALDPKLERFIAIKCLSEELSNDEIVVARFLREARNVAALNHPNIAQIFVADEHEGKPYFVMEYVDGESLADFIAREGQCSPEMARRVTEQSAEALAAAAEENIVHRDVKPGNIMLDRRGRAVLTDFGIACVMASSEAGDRSTTLMGTPGYLPPEVLTGSQPDHRGDIFALGLVYFEMLTGQRLVGNTDLKTTLGQYMQSDFPDLSVLEGKVDDRVVGIIRRMLAVRPDQRYSDCQALLADMAPLKTGRTGPVERSVSGPTTAETEATRALGLTGAASADAETRQIGAQAQTETVETASAAAPATVPVEREPGSGRGRRYALLGVLALSLVMIALGIARMDEANWDRVTGLFPGGDSGGSEPVVETDDLEPPVPAADLDEAVVVDTEASSDADAEAAESARAGKALIDEAAGESAEPMDGSPALAETAQDESPAEASEAIAGPADATPEQQPARPDLDDGAGTEVAAIPQPAVEPEPAAPTGVVVIGIGDPVITDPMVREIEQALRTARPPLVDRRFIHGYQQFIQGDDIDLAGLAETAREAGVRYIVVARALPAGTRELQFYNRYETAYIVQLEAKTFDLHRGRELGSSPLEQIEYTSLNATERARQSVRPWLSGLRDQFN